MNSKVEREIGGKRERADKTIITAINSIFRGQCN